MATFVMLTRLAAPTLDSPDAFEKLEQAVAKRIGTEIPSVEWVQNLAVLGPYDYLDIFRAPDIDTAMKVAAIVRSVGHAHVEIWAGDEWKRFKSLMRELGR